LKQVEVFFEVYPVIARYAFFYGVCYGGFQESAGCLNYGGYVFSGGNACGEAGREEVACSRVALSDVGECAQGCLLS